MTNKSLAKMKRQTEKQTDTGRQGVQTQTEGGREISDRVQWWWVYRMGRERVCQTSWPPAKATSWKYVYRAAQAAGNVFSEYTSTTGRGKGGERRGQVYTRERRTEWKRNKREENERRERKPGRKR